MKYMKKQEQIALSVIAKQRILLLIIAFDVVEALDKRAMQHKKAKVKKANKVQDKG